MKKIVVLLVIFGVTSSAKAAEEVISDDDIPELQYMNKSVDPCDDFYEFACGNFKNVHPLSDDDLTIDQFTLLKDKLLELNNAILSAEDTDEDPVALKKARAAYKACVDVDYVDSLKDPETTVVDEQHGFPLVQPLYTRGKTRFGWNDIGKAVGKYGVPMIFSIDTYPDLANASRNVVRISSDSMENPTLFRTQEEVTYESIIEQGFREFSTKRTKRSALAPFDIFLRKVAFKVKAAIGSELTEDEIIDNINVMANFMRGVYQGGYIPDDTVIETFTGMSISLEELNNWTKRHFGDEPQIDWIEYLGNIFANAGVQIDKDTEVMTPQGLAELIYGILNWVSMNDPETVKNLVMTRVFLYMAPDGDAEDRAEFEEYYKGLNLATLPRELYCTRKITDAIGTASLSFALAYEYQLRYFNVNQLTKALQMIRDVQASFKETLDEITWMDDSSKQMAAQKVNNVVTNLGYPEFVADKTLLDKFYENVRICKWDNYGNSKSIRAFRQAYQMSQIAKRDRDFWNNSPFETNAYYSRANNKIIFPVAMLNPVFFGTNSSVLDYGRIGSVIGHEITHGFDAQGQMYDQDGVLQEWWTPETKATFINLTQCFIDQYSKYYIPEVDGYIDSTVTLNENIADNGGARQSFRALKKLLDRLDVKPRTKDFSAEQLFFIGFGTMWCNNPSTPYLLSQRTDPHSASKWRVNGVLSNMEAFAETFSCKAGSNMNPLNKCRLW